MTFAQSVGDIPTWLDTGGIVGILAVVVWGALRGWWVTKAQLDRELKIRDDTIERLLAERNHFIEIALRATNSAEKSTEHLLHDRGADLEDIARSAVWEALERIQEGKSR